MEQLLSFLLACLIIELTPGPNMMYLAMLSSVRGRRAGLSLVAGISTGLFTIALAGAGISPWLQRPDRAPKIRKIFSALLFMTALWLVWATRL